MTGLGPRPDCAEGQAAREEWMRLSLGLWEGERGVRHSFRAAAERTEMGPLGENTAGEMVWPFVPAPWRQPQAQNG